MAVLIAICGGCRALRSAQGSDDRCAAAGDAGVCVSLCPIRLAGMVLLSAATTKEHRGYEEERRGMTHENIMARLTVFWYSVGPLPQAASGRFAASILSG
jgi:hypothetical protein